jgi:hypothetical protein
MELGDLLRCEISSSHGGLMMEAARTSETSVDTQLRIRQYIPEDSELIYYGVHERPPMDILSHLNPFSTITPYYSQDSF